MSLLANLLANEVEASATPLAISLRLLSHALTLATHRLPRLSRSFPR